jgi:hypothetical protein
MNKTIKLIFWQRITVGILLFSLGVAGVNTLKANNRINLLDNQREAAEMGLAYQQKISEKYEKRIADDAKVISALNQKIKKREVLHNQTVAFPKDFYCIPARNESKKADLEGNGVVGQ